MAIQRYRRRPQTVKPRDTGLTTARYDPGEPLDDLQAVARMANQLAELAEAELPSGRVLVVKYIHLFGNGDGEPEFVVVLPRGLLGFSHAAGDLTAYDGPGDLRRWYEPVEVL